MRDMHVWNLLASHVPNALPRSVPWLRLHNWHISVAHSQWPRHAGRLIWASLLLLVGIVVAFVLVRRPKPAEPVAVEEGETPVAPSGPFARFRRRREVRVSAYGRPVTTPE